MEKSREKRPLIFKWPLLFEGEGGPWSIQTSSKHIGFAFKIRIMMIATEIGPVENTLFEFFIARIGTQSPIFSNCLRNRPWNFFQHQIGCRLPPKKSSYWPMDSRKGHQLGGGFGCVSFTSGCIRGVFVRCGGVPGEKPTRFSPKKSAVL